MEEKTTDWGEAVTMPAGLLQLNVERIRLLDNCDTYIGERKQMRMLFM